jgi:hypothetical protein
MNGRATEDETRLTMWKLLGVCGGVPIEDRKKECPSGMDKSHMLKADLA